MGTQGGRPASAAALIVAAVGVLIFGSVVTGAGEWVEGRELATVGWWAFPGLVVAFLSFLVSARALATRDRGPMAPASALLVAASLLALVLLNPAIAPPVP